MRDDIIFFPPAILGQLEGSSHDWNQRGSQRVFIIYKDYTWSQYFPFKLGVIFMICFVIVSTTPNSVILKY